MRFQMTIGVESDAGDDQLWRVTVVREVPGDAEAQIQLPNHPLRAVAQVENGRLKPVLWQHQDTSRKRPQVAQLAMEVPTDTRLGATKALRAALVMAGVL